MELNQDAVFKEAVLSQAEARSMGIISDAGKKRAQVLEEAYKQCESSDYSVIKAQYSQESEKNISFVMGQARRELLEYRESLVAEMFDELEKRLRAFTQGEAYGAWLLARVKKHGNLAGEGKTPTLYLREADLDKAEELQKALPGCQVKTDNSIHLGGVKMSEGHCLFDESLDAALAAERQAFYERGELRL